jgi:formylglycine-generating enzyme required for sulfatase activity
MPNNYFDTGNSGNFMANYGNGNINYPLKDVGSYPLSKSPYGTLDQAGNVAEWNETLFYNTRGVRGGAWNGHPGDSRAPYLGGGSPTQDYYEVGFRIASTAVPEPLSIALVLAACAIVCGPLRVPH